MKVPWLKSPLADDGPFLSIHLDTTRTDANASAELSTRWHLLRGRLSQEGAPPGILDEIEESVLTPSPIGGRTGRTIIASPREILLDRVLPAPPREDAVSFGPAPMLLPLLRLTQIAVSHLLIEVDRAGANIHLRAPDNPDAPPDQSQSVDGGHDELHKANNGGAQHGWRARNFDARVEDSWERNAEAVARTVDSLVHEHKPDLVLVTGDVRAASLLLDALGTESRARLQRVSGGTRGVSLDRASFRAEVEKVTRAYIDRRQKSVAEAFHENQLRGGTSVAGVSEVRGTLSRGQVEDLVFLIGQEPPEIEDLLRQAIATDAGISALDPGFVAVPEGVGALLRWRDGATPSNELSSMTGDPRREDALHT